MHDKKSVIGIIRVRYRLRHDPTSTFKAESRRSRQLLLSVKNNYQQKKWGESYPDPYRLIYANPDEVEYYLLSSDKTDYHYAKELENDVRDLYQADKARFRRRVILGVVSFDMFE